MESAGPRPRRPLVAARLLEHYEAIGRLTDGDTTSARARLESALGPALASRLVGALAERHPRPFVVL